MKFGPSNLSFLANLGRKSQNYPFCLKTGTHCILEKLIQIPYLEFRNLNPKIHFWENLGGKSFPCLFLFFETSLLFLDIQLAFVLYLEIALHSSAAIYRWSENTNCLYFYFIVHIYIYIYIHIYNMISNITRVLNN